MDCPACHSTRGELGAVMSRRLRGSEDSTSNALPALQHPAPGRRSGTETRLLSEPVYAGSLVESDVTAVEVHSCRKVDIQ
jgi:hypothetical protein